MATTVENLETRLNAITAELAALSTVGPDFSIDGVSMSYTEYRKSLLDEIAQIQQLLLEFDGPAVVITQGR